jgi:hypothetical protein
MNWGFDRLGWIRRLEFTAVVAAAAAVGCVILGQGAERYASIAAPPADALADAEAGKTMAGTRGGPIFNTIDYATTGSIKGQTVVISPCTGRQVER